MDNITNPNGKAFVKEMRVLAARRDLASSEEAIAKMRSWMELHPDDQQVGMALEEFDILAEAASIVESRQLQPSSAA
jgi:hypothetical protein